MSEASRLTAEDFRAARQPRLTFERRPQNPLRASRTSARRCHSRQLAASYRNVRFLLVSRSMDGPHPRTLQKALALLNGSKIRLAEKVAVSPEDIDAYLSGDTPVPLPVFLHALDIVAGTEPRGAGEGVKRQRQQQQEQAKDDRKDSPSE